MYIHTYIHMHTYVTYTPTTYIHVPIHILSKYIYMYIYMYIYTYTFTYKYTYTHSHSYRNSCNKCARAARLVCHMSCYVSRHTHIGTHIHLGGVGRAARLTFALIPNCVVGHSLQRASKVRDTVVWLVWVLWQPLCDVYGCKGKQLARHTASQSVTASHCQYAQATCAECGRRVSGHTAWPAVSRSVPTDSPPTFSQTQGGSSPSLRARRTGAFVYLRTQGCLRHLVTFALVRLYIYVYTYMYTYTYICIYMFMHIYVHTYVYTYIYMYIHTYIHMHTYDTYTRTTYRRVRMLPKYIHT